MTKKPAKAMPPPIAAKFANYPEKPRHCLEKMRALIFDLCAQENLGEPEETLKWGEPSYLIAGGSPVRYDWSSKEPGDYRVYFNCNTKLVETFKEIYGDVFEFKANRAISFALDEVIPEKELKHCLLLAFRYHSVKQQPLLGA